MDYKTLLKNRRSIREFNDQTIDAKILDEILHDTCMAPSSSNTQPWRFIIVQDKEMMKRLSDESKKRLLLGIEENPKSSIKKYASMLSDPEFNVFYDAPCLIIIAGKNDHYHFMQDCSLAAAYLMFAATARGLGTCWIGLGEAIADLNLRKEIGLPEDHEIAASIIIGYPVSIPEIVLRNEPIVLKSL